MFREYLEWALQHLLMGFVVLHWFRSFQKLVEENPHG